MKICWENLDKLVYDSFEGLWVEEFTYTRKGRVKPQKGRYKYKYIDACKWCNEPFLSLISNSGNFCSKSCGVSHKQTGKVGYWKGKTFTNATKEKISKSNRGKERTEEMRKRYSHSKLGSKNPMYGRRGPDHPMYGRRGPDHPMYGRRGPDHPMYGKKGHNSQINLEAMYKGLRDKLRSEGLPFNDNEHPFKGVKRPNNSGPNNYFWKGGVTKPNEAFRKSMEYKYWRESIFKRDNYTCQRCGSHGGRLNAHHIVPFNHIMSNNIKKLKLNIDNGLTLCEHCHKKYHKINGYKK